MAGLRMMRISCIRQICNTATHVHTVNCTAACLNTHTHTHTNTEWPVNGWHMAQPTSGPIAWGTALLAK